VQEEAAGIAAGVSHALSGAAHAASDTAGAIGGRVSDSASGVLQTAKDAAGQAKAIGGSAAGKAIEYGQRAQQSVAGMIDREPLLIGGLGLLAGLAIGAALPATEVEKRYVGPLKDKVVDKTKEIAQDRLDDVSEATEAVYHAVKDELSKEGGQGENVAHRADHGVYEAEMSMRDPLSRPH